MLSLRSQDSTLHYGMHWPRNQDLEWRKERACGEPKSELKVLPPPIRALFGIVFHACRLTHTHLSLAGCPWIRLISWVARKKIFKLQRPFHKYSPQTQHFPNTLYNTEYADYAEGGCKIASLRFSRKYHRSPPVAPFSESAKKFIRWDSDFKRNF